MYLGYALTVAYLPKFSSSIAFTCIVCQNFPMYGRRYSRPVDCFNRILIVLLEYSDTMLGLKQIG